MNTRCFFKFVAPALAAATLAGQSLDPARLLKPPTDSWPTYNGDYSGRRYSPLTQINAGNINTLTLAWAMRANTGAPGAPAIKSTPLEVNGVLYFAVPDHAWAVDARSGRELWHFKWDTKGGIHIGNRGFGMYGNWLFFETPDCYLISLDARTGKMRWNHQIADVKQEYFCTPAPMVIRGHVLVGVGGDSLDLPGYLESRDPETGEVQWRWNTTPRPGEPAAETWPTRTSMEHGGGMTWLSGTYDPELNLYYLGTGNPNPVHAAQSRAGDNLYTCSIVALNPDTGKIAWYYQISRHDTHDWDAVGTPVLIEGVFDGRPRKMLAQAARNGYFFLLDRTNGKNLLTVPFLSTVNWAKGIDSEGHPIPNPAKDPKTDGTLVSPASGGAANWPAPTFNPDTGLFYFHATDSYAVYYLTDTDEQPEGYGGRDEGAWSQNLLQAIDYRTGKIAWSHRYPNLGGSRSGLLSTAGKLLFGGDPTGNLIAFDPADGRLLWHVALGAPVSNGPITFELDGRQYLVAAAGEMLFAFTLPAPPR
jgi:alcohol dehydrogenase (cytochrome c)